MPLTLSKPLIGDLASLAANIETMGEFANVQFSDAVHALLHRDIAQAERVIEQDRELDGLRRDVSLAAAIVIARRQPVAADLNEVLADLRIAGSGASRDIG
jgi:phosphate transport system protein